MLEKLVFFKKNVKHTVLQSILVVDAHVLYHHFYHSHSKFYTNSN